MAVVIDMAVVHRHVSRSQTYSIIVLVHTMEKRRVSLPGKLRFGGHIGLMCLIMSLQCTKSVWPSVNSCRVATFTVVKVMWVFKRPGWLPTPTPPEPTLLRR